MLGTNLAHRERNTSQKKAQTCSTLQHRNHLILLKKFANRIKNNYLDPHPALQLHCKGPTGKVSRIRAVFGVCMGLILMPRLGNAVVIRKIDRLSSRRADFETRRQEANALSMEHALVDKVSFSVCTAPQHTVPARRRPPQRAS